MFLRVRNLVCLGWILLSAVSHHEAVVRWQLGLQSSEGLNGAGEAAPEAVPSHAEKQVVAHRCSLRMCDMRGTLRVTSEAEKEQPD